MKREGARIYYLSKILIEVETRYNPVEKLCLALYFTTCKLRYYMLPCHIHIISKTDVIKYMLSKPMLTGRIGKWILALLEFSFQYVPQRPIKGQAIANFLYKHQDSKEELVNITGTLEVASLWILLSKGHSSREELIQQEVKRITSLSITPWKLYFDGSCIQHVANVRIVIIDPKGIQNCYSFLLGYQQQGRVRGIDYWLRNPDRVRSK
ncbi:hypothetical protein ACFXTN_008493 [Malus domestica]